MSIGRIAFLTISAVCLYLFLPKLAEVFEAWNRLGELDARWLPVIVGTEIASFWTVWYLQRLALREKATWFTVIATQLAGNTFNRITPGGGATGAALQSRMLADAGIPLTAAASAMAAHSILVSAALSILPICSVPLLAFAGRDVPDELLAAAWIGVAVFAFLAVLIALLLSTEKPLAFLGRVVDNVAARLRNQPQSGLAERLVRERDEVRRLLGANWLKAVAAAIGRWLFEYLALLAVLVAIGASPDPMLTLLAFEVASLLSLVPLTPGGLGFVEVGLTGSLVAAGVTPNAAILATLVFRLVSFWLPLPMGLGAWYGFRRRYPRANGAITD